MGEEDIEKLLSDPEKLINFLDNNPESINNIKKSIDSGRSFIREKYKMNNTEIEAVEFCFWFTYFVERETRNMIIYPEIMSGARLEAINKIIDRLHFGDIISLIADLYIKDLKKDNCIKMLWKINDLRNDIAHGRFDNLKYGEYYLSDPRGQLKIIMDFQHSLLRNKKTDN